MGGKGYKEGQGPKILKQMEAEVRQSCGNGSTGLHGDRGKAVENKKTGQEEGRRMVKPTGYTECVAKWAGQRKAEE